MSIFGKPVEVDEEELADDCWAAVDPDEVKVEQVTTGQDVLDEALKEGEVSYTQYFRESAYNRWLR